MRSRAAACLTLCLLLQAVRAQAGEAADGAKLFAEQCSACHRPDGQGRPGQFPPLAGNRDLFLSADFPARVLLAGLEGKVTVKGRLYDSAMPPMSHLSDAEIAAVLAYVRSAWGNAKLRPPRMPPLDAAAVATLRAENPTSERVLALRLSLQQRAGK
jgi:mono/diheme cytochrome c family protein